MIAFRPHDSSYASLVMNNEQQIIATKEARKLIPKEVSDQLNDVEVEGIITQLDFLATLFVKRKTKELAVPKSTVVTCADRQEP